MMNELTTQDNSHNKQFNLRYIRGKEEDRHDIFMIDVALIKEIIKIGIDQTVEIGKYHLV